MYFQPQKNASKSEDPLRTVYIYENSCNNKQPVQYQIRNQCNAFREIAQLMKIRRLRLFNEEGAQYFEDDLKFVKNRTSLYASKGEEFDPHNCFGQYEMVSKLGEGGFGKVFLAKHKHSGEKCAIKIIKISSISDIDSIFVQAEILKSLKHDNIVKVTNCLTLKNMEVAIIMEYLQGGELLKYVQNEGKLDEETCKTFLRQIVKGIMYCHENNLIHRDLKLENIMLVNSEEKKIKIIDFGIAGVMSRLTEEDLDAGSLGYMAPQCFLSFANNPSNENNFKFDGRMDVWSIGVILFSMLCAELPFKGSNNHEIKQNIKKGQYKIHPDVKKAISSECLNVIFRCLDPNPKTRIKIGQLMTHQWFATPGMGEDKSLLNLKYLQKEIKEEIYEDQPEIKSDNPTERPQINNVLNPIHLMQDNARTSKSNFAPRSASKAKKVNPKATNSSFYKMKPQSQHHSGKQNAKAIKLKL